MSGEKENDSTILCGSNTTGGFCLRVRRRKGVRVCRRSPLRFPLLWSLSETHPPPLHPDGTWLDWPPITFTTQKRRASWKSLMQCSGGERAGPQGLFLLAQKSTWKKEFITCMVIPYKDLILRIIKQLESWKPWKGLTFLSLARNRICSWRIEK